MKRAPNRLALNTASLGHNIEGHGAGLSPEAVIDLCAAKGLGGVVFWRREIDDARRVGDYARSAALPVIGLCRTPYLIGRDADMGDLQASLDMAATLGAPVLTIVTGGIEPGTKGVAPSLDALRLRVEKALPLAEAAGVILALEPLHPIYAANRGALCSASDAVDIACEFDHPNLKIAIDIYHVWWDSGLASALSRAKGRIAGFHLCDWLEDTRDMLLDRGMMGDGVADIRAISGMVEGAGFDGLAEVEIFSRDHWWKRDPAEVIDVMIARYQTVC